VCPSYELVIGKVCPCYKLVIGKVCSSYEFVRFQGFGWLVYVVCSDSLHADCREGEGRRVTARRGRRGRGWGSVRIAPPSHPLGVPRAARAGHAGLHAAAELHHGPPAAAPAGRSVDVPGDGRGVRPIGYQWKRHTGSRQDERGRAWGGGFEPSRTLATRPLP